MKRILGIGNALVDIMTRLEDDNFLTEAGLPKGSMQLVGDEVIENLAKKIDSLTKSISAGGSAANTINGLANLGVECGFIGVVGDDEMGNYFVEDMKKAGIKPHLYKSLNKSGVALALVSPDSERTFATFLGAAMELTEKHLDEHILKQYDIIHIEGYLVQNYELIKGIMKKAKACGLKISLDLASYNVVEANLEFLKEMVKEYVDILFANEEEAKAFTGMEPEDALHLISEHCLYTIVKTGKNGSLIKNGETVHKVGVIQVNSIDTTGAGDLYASGFLFGLIHNYPLDMCGKFGALLAGNVIEVIGSKMDKERWERVKKEISL
ncbi:MAG: adenosine kinase [Bacteroidales bacterium]|nr:adenosine kinase [Bacteroidales bacterium]